MLWMIVFFFSQTLLSIVSDERTYDRAKNSPIVGKKRENPKGKKIAAEISIENPLQIIVIMYRTLMHNCIPD